MGSSFLAAILGLSVYHVYRAAAGEGGDDGGGGSGGGDQDLDPQVLLNQLAEARKALEGERRGRTKLLTEAKELRDRLSVIGDDFDPEEYRKMREDVAAREAEEQKKQGNYEQSLRQLTEKFTNEKQSLQQQAEADRRAANELFADRELSRAFTSGNGNKEMLELFAGNISKYYQVSVDEHGHRSIVFVDPSNPKEPLRNKQMKLIETPDEFIAYVREETKLAFYFDEDPTPKGTNVTKGGGDRTSSGKRRVNLNDPVEYGKYAAEVASGEAIGYEG